MNDTIQVKKKEIRNFPCC